MASMAAEAVAPEVFEDLPQWDEDATWDTCELFDDLPHWDDEEMFDGKPLLQVIWDREVAEELLMSLAEVIWDDEPPECGLSEHVEVDNSVGAAQDMFSDLTPETVLWDDMNLVEGSKMGDEMCGKVVWDEDLSQDSGLLEQLALGEDYKDNAGYTRDNGFLQCPAHVISLSHPGIRRSEFGLSLGARSLWQSVRIASTATTGQPKMDTKDEQSEDQKRNKKKKEASPEQCDQAVEGLSTSQAKAKAKHVQESRKASQSVMQECETRILGIDPTFRVVASISRVDWPVMLKHWKDEFASTLQHYWLGTKILWADSNISSRLLVKLAGGKSLSRRHRQQLTHTSVRMQWDPGISTVTAWGQAVFRGVGNVMTRSWAKQA